MTLKGFIEKDDFEKISRADYKKHAKRCHSWPFPTKDNPDKQSPCSRLNGHKFGTDAKVCLSQSAAELAQQQKHQSQDKRTSA